MFLLPLGTWPKNGKIPKLSLWLYYLISMGSLLFIVEWRRQFQDFYWCKIAVFIRQMRCKNRVKGSYLVYQKFHNKTHLFQSLNFPDAMAWHNVPVTFIKVNSAYNVSELRSLGIAFYYKVLYRWNVGYLLRSPGYK